MAALIILQVRFLLAVPMYSRFSSPSGQSTDRFEVPAFKNTNELHGKPMVASPSCAFNFRMERMADKNPSLHHHHDSLRKAFIKKSWPHAGKHAAKLRSAYVIEVRSVSDVHVPT